MSEYKEVWLAGLAMLLTRCGGTVGVQTAAAGEPPIQQDAGHTLDARAAGSLDGSTGDEPDGRLAPIGDPEISDATVLTSADDGAGSQPVSDAGDPNSQWDDDGSDPSTCDPFDHGSCPSGQACVSIGFGFECGPGGPGGDFDECGFEHGMCQTGFMCANLGGLYRCIRFCRYSDPNGCPRGTVCTDYVPKAGVCL